MTTMTTRTTTITQEYYDELCVENLEVFDLDDEDQAVKETEEQLLQQLTTPTDHYNEPKDDEWCLSHLSRTFPTSPQGLEERRQIRHFQSLVQSLVRIQDDTTTTTHNQANDTLDRTAMATQIQAYLTGNPVLYLSLLLHMEDHPERNHQGGGLTALLVIAAAASSTHKDDADHSQRQWTALQTLHHVLTTALQRSNHNNTQVRNAVIGHYQQAVSSTMTSVLSTWVQTLYSHVQTMDTTTTTTTLLSRRLDELHHILVLLWFAVKQCEANKQRFLQLRILPTNNDKNDNESTPADAVHTTSSHVLVHCLTQLVRVAQRYKEDHHDNDDDKDQDDTNTTPQTRLLHDCIRATCRLGTSLCTFEPELRWNQNNNQKNQPPLVSSAHDAVLSLATAGWIPALSQVWTWHDDEQQQSSCSTTDFIQSPPSWDPSPWILALRAMAIQNQVVQSMVTVGLLHQACRTFHHLVVALATTTAGTTHSAATTTNNHTSVTTTTPPAWTVDTLVALVGLFRNMSANDEIKTMLCLGRSSDSNHTKDNNNSNNNNEVMSIVPSLVQVMTTPSHPPLLQEHACGTIAAMALRQPRNAQFLVVTHAVHVAIVQVMQRHASSAPLQRQAALALRNLVSRDKLLTNVASVESEGQQSQPQPQPLVPLLLQAGAQQALLQYAAPHASCQDEVYAALRELGVDGVSMVHHVRVVDSSGTEQVVVQPTPQFGAVASNFRPVYE